MCSSDLKVLVFPSMIDEGFGRVIVEAGFYGIPAVSTMRGGQIEAVGEGGILISSTSIKEWQRTINNIENDYQYYLELSNKARINSSKFVRDVVSELKDAQVL